MVAWTSKNSATKYVPKWNHVEDPSLAPYSIQASRACFVKCFTQTDTTSRDHETPCTFGSPQFSTLPSKSYSMRAEVRGAEGRTPPCQRAIIYAQISLSRCTDCSMYPRQCRLKYNTQCEEIHKPLRWMKFQADGTPRQSIGTDGLVQRHR